MTGITNKKDLLESSELPQNREARTLALNSLDAALKAVEPEHLVKSKVRLADKRLQVDSLSLDLKRYSRVYVVGGGKASGIMAKALEDILGGVIDGGWVNIPLSDKTTTQTVTLHRASHPIPDERGVEGTRKMLSLVGQAGERGLVICLISGGGSSLTPLPRGNISLEDLKELTNSLLRSGATINEINAVRKHLSRFKGGWLAKEAYPATVVNLILSDVVGDPLDVISSGPTVPDSSTFGDAIHVLKKYKLWRNCADSVRKMLLKGESGGAPETPKAGDPAFVKTYNHVIGNNFSASNAAYSQLRASGVNTLFLTSHLEGEARHVGSVFAALVREIKASGTPVQKPAGIVVGGETTVTVVGDGVGGRNQELVLSAALNIRGLQGAVVASMSTDGVDGPTDAAGALADGETIIKAGERGLEAEQYLMNNDSYTFLSRMNSLIFTGPTGTNVNDVSVIVVV